MYKSLEAGYCVLGKFTAPGTVQTATEPAASPLESVLVEYFSDTTTCLDKLRFWKEIDFKRKLAAECNFKPEHLGMVKTILFSYLSDDREHHFLVSTLAEKQVDYDEVRVELGMSGEEAQSLKHKLSDTTIEAITGKKRGAISPLLDAEHLHKIETIYFTHDLMRDALKHPEKRYDLPRSLSISEFWNAATLLKYLQQKSSQYRTAGDFENELSLKVAAKDWKIKKIDLEKAGYSYLFGGTTVSYQAQTWRLPTPPMTKDGVDRKRKEIACIAFPVSRTEKGMISYEYTERGRKRLILPITYESLENLAQK